MEKQDNGKFFNFNRATGVVFKLMAIVSLFAFVQISTAQTDLAEAVIALSSDEFVYNGKEQTPEISQIIAGTSVVAIVKSDLVLEIKSDGEESIEAVGRKILTIRAKEASDGDDQEYTNNTYIGSKEVEYEIIPKELRVDGLTAEKRSYSSGDVNVVVNGDLAELNVNDVVDADKISGKINGSKLFYIPGKTLSGTMSDDKAGTGKDVTVGGWELGGSSAGNYNLISELTVDITPKIIDLTEIEFDDDDILYDTDVHKLSVDLNSINAGIQSDGIEVKAVYSYNNEEKEGVSEVGEYEVSASFEITLLDVETAETHLDNFALAENTTKTANLGIYYEVDFNINKGTAAKDENGSDVVYTGWKYYGDKIDETPTAPKKDGYTFGDWLLYSLNTSYSDFDFDDFKDSYDGHESQFTFVAQWNTESYEIAYNFNDENSVSKVEDFEPVVSYTIEDEIELQNPIREGYEFKGWFDNADLSGDKVTSISNETGNKEFWASWEEEEYSIAYNYGDGESISKVEDFEPAVSYTIEDEIELQNPTRKGYEFKGWFDNENLEGDKVTFISNETDDKEFWASWEVINYNIDYTLKDDESDQVTKNDNSETYTIDTEGFELNDPVRYGYEFKGWFDNEDFAGDEITTIAKGNAENITLFAKWEKALFEITWKLENITEATEFTKSFEYRTALPTFELTEEEIAELEDYTINAEGNPVKNSDATNIYSFKSWTPALAEVTGNATYTATYTYEVRGYTVSFNSNGGNPIESVNAPHNTAISAPENPSRLGYDFAYWYSEDEEVPFDFTSPITEDITLTAKWTDNIQKLVDDYNKIEAEYSGLLGFYKELAEKLVGVFNSIDPENQIEINDYENGIIETDNAANLELLAVVGTELLTRGETIAEKDLEIEELEREIEAADAEIERLEGELEAADAEIERLEGDLADAGAEIERLESELADANAEIERLEGELADAETEIERLDGLLTAEKDKVTALTAEKATLAENLDTEKAKVTALTAEKAALAENLATEKGKVTALTAEKATLTENLATANGKITEWQNKHADLNAKHTDLNTKHTELNATHAALQTKHTELNTAHTDLKEDYEALLKELEDCNGVPVSKIEKSSALYGIRFENNIVSDKAEMTVVLPNNESVSEIKTVVYDMTGNIVFNTAVRGKNVSWDLTNKAGRIVANGTYLVIAEVKGMNGNVSQYSAKLGVKR